MGRLSFDLNSETLLTRSKMSLPISMKEYLKTTADEAYDDTFLMPMRGDVKTTA